MDDGSILECATSITIPNDILNKMTYPHIPTALERRNAYKAKKEVKEVTEDTCEEVVEEEAHSSDEEGQYANLLAAEENELRRGVAPSGVAHSLSTFAKGGSAPARRGAPPPPRNRPAQPKVRTIRARSAPETARALCTTKPDSPPAHSTSVGTRSQVFEEPESYFDVPQLM